MDDDFELDWDNIEFEEMDRNVELYDPNKFEEDDELDDSFMIYNIDEKPLLNDTDTNFAEDDILDDDLL